MYPVGQMHFPLISHVISGTPGRLLFGHEHSVNKGRRFQVNFALLCNHYSNTAPQETQVGKMAFAFQFKSKANLTRLF